jgi:CheY-like chemotaxis protein/nitrogen-specific signal transduction histidine kinase/HPt (histidine-containing phosphotransfer) domain-containing protein
MNESDPAEQIQALRDALAAERRKGAAFNELSHELRTLIAGVLGLTGLLLETDLTPEQRDYVKRVRGLSDALVGLVNNVLDFSRLEAGKLELASADLDLRRLVDDVGELCAERAFTRGVELVTSVANDVPALRGDANRVRQVLMNLVSNALKFTGRGEVVLHAALAEVPGPPPSKVVVRFEVRDTGVGISPEGQGRLFLPFSQVHAGDAVKGSGLGLALSKELVEAMGGTIGVTSELGRGSTFHFTIPFDPRPHAVDRNAIPRVDMAGRRVLAAVPNAASRACLAEMAAPLGLSLDAAPDGESARAALRAASADRAYDVILLDAGLPGAADLMRVLDGDASLSAVPVVILAYPGQRWGDADDPPSSGAAPLAAPSVRTAHRTARRVASRLAKPVRQAHLHACLTTLMGSSVETVARQPSHAEPPKAPRPAAPAADRPLVLLVEDNAVNQRVARLMLERRGYQVDVAADGHEAILATAHATYAAVLMDCQMPRCDGYSATLEIRKRDGQLATGAPRPGRTRVPIIAMTANAGPGARERCLAAGMDDYIAKPVSAESLVSVLRRWVRGAPVATGATATAAVPVLPRPPAATVDLGMLRQMRASQAAGDPDIVAEVIALFLQDAPLRLAAVRDAVAAGDLPSAARAAHTLKGSAGHLGARTLSALCAHFEDKVRAGAPFDVAFAVGAISDELDRVSVALAAEPRSRH